MKNSFTADDGVSLVLVLFFVAIASLLIGTASKNSFYSVKTVGLELRRSQEMASLQGAINELTQAFRVHRDRSSHTLHTTGIWNDCTFFDGNVISYRLFDHDGMIDINLASKNLLAAGFEAISVSPENALYLSERVMDFRDVNIVDDKGNLETLEFVKGPKASLFGVKNGAFSSVFELDQIPFFDISDLPEAHQVFTIHGRLDGIDPDVAPEIIRPYIKGSGTFRRKSREVVYSLEVAMQSEREFGLILHRTFNLHSSNQAFVLPASVRSKEYYGEVRSPNTDNAPSCIAAWEGGA